MLCLHQCTKSSTAAPELSIHKRGSICYNGVGGYRLTALYSTVKEARAGVTTWEFLLSWRRGVVGFIISIPVSQDLALLRLLT